MIEFTVTAEFTLFGPPRFRKFVIYHFKASVMEEQRETIFFVKHRQLCRVFSSEGRVLFITKCTSARSGSKMLRHVVIFFCEHITSSPQVIFPIVFLL